MDKIKDKRKMIIILADIFVDYQNKVRDDDFYAICRNSTIDLEYNVWKLLLFVKINWILNQVLFKN